MQEFNISLHAIGIFRGKNSSKHRAPRQPDDKLGLDGIIELQKGSNFEQALLDLDTFTHIWLIYGFHEAKGWKPMVLPPRGNKKRGVFATRSPYRPNPIGISVVTLLGIEGLHLSVSGTDLIDGTPIYDIKPYIPYADIINRAESGWIQQIDTKETTVEYSEDLLHNDSLSEIMIHARQILRDSPFPHPYRRIKHLQGNRYELSIREWRIFYDIVDEHNVRIDAITQAGSIK